MSFCSTSSLYHIMLLVTAVTNNLHSSCAHYLAKKAYIGNISLTIQSQVTCQVFFFQQRGEKKLAEMLFPKSQQICVGLERNKVLLGHVYHKIMPQLW